MPTDVAAPDREACADRSRCGHDHSGEPVRSNIVRVDRGGEAGRRGGEEGGDGSAPSTPFVLR